MFPSRSAGGRERKMNDAKGAPWEMGAGECLCHAGTGIAFRLLGSAEKAPDGTYGYRARTFGGRDCFIPLSEVVFGAFVKLNLTEEEHGRP